MAVPKRKTSKSRRNKRRSHHKVKDVNIIEDNYSVLNESGDFNFEAEDTLTTLIKYVNDIEVDAPKDKLKDLMKVLYTEAHDYI